MSSIFIISIDARFIFISIQLYKNKTKGHKKTPHRFHFTAFCCLFFFLRGSDWKPIHRNLLHLINATNTAHVLRIRSHNHNCVSFAHFSAHAAYENNFQPLSPRHNSEQFRVGTEWISEFRREKQEIQQPIFGANYTNFPPCRFNSEENATFRHTTG